MPAHPDLFASTRPSPPGKYSVFLAVLPDRGAIEHLSEITAGLRTRHGLKGRPRPLDHLHITLHYFDDYVEVQDNLIRVVGQACEIAAELTPPFEITLDRAVSFRGRPESSPLVLTGRADGNADLTSLHKTLLKELVKARCVGKGSSGLKPHLTLLYDGRRIAEEAIDPVIWRISEIVLISSEVGATKHHHLGQWKLNA